MQNASVQGSSTGVSLIADIVTVVKSTHLNGDGFSSIKPGLSFDNFAQEYKLAMIGQLRHMVTRGADVFGNFQRVDKRMHREAPDELNSH